MSSQASMPLSATDGTYSTPPIGASATTDPNTSSNASTPSPSAPQSSAPTDAATTLSSTPEQKSASTDASQAMDTEEKTAQPDAVPSSHAHSTAHILPSPSLSASHTSDNVQAVSGERDTAENKLDTADDEYVMVDKPTDDEMQSTDTVTTQLHPTPTTTATNDEEKAATTNSALPTTPQRQAAKRRSELDSDLNTQPILSLSRSGRQRKPPTAFTPFAPSERPHVEQSAGQGTPVADLPNVVRRIDNSKSDSPEIRRFYSLCFPLIRPPPHKSKIKSVLKTFSGLTTDEQRHSAKGKLKRMWKEEKSAVLYRLMLLMDLDYVDGDDGVVECHEAIMRWLERPTASGREFVTVKAKYAEKSSGSKKKKKRSSSGGGRSDSKKRRSADGSDSDSDGSGSSDSDGDSTPRKSKSSPSSSSSSSSSKKSKSKGGSEGKKKSTLRTANSFVVFTSARREEFRAANPSLTAQEVTSGMAAMWRELPSEEKEVYELAAKRLREDALKEEREAGGGDNKKRKPPAKKRSSEKKQPAAKKQKKAAALPMDDGKDSDAGEHDNDAADDSGDGTGDDDGSDSGTEDEDDVAAGNVQHGASATNGSSKAADDTNNTAAAAGVKTETESSATTPSHAASDVAMKTE